MLEKRLKLTFKGLPPNVGVNSPFELGGWGAFAPLFD